MESMFSKPFAVAFLDVLGFKDFIVDLEKGNASATERFSKLLEVIRAPLQSRQDSVAAEKFPDDLDLQCVGISDSFIVSAPLSKINGYSGLVAVCIKTAQLAHKLLQLGFLVRGGVAVGKLHRDGISVFGTSYQNAYKTESDVAKVPRILLHDSAKVHVQEGVHFGRRIIELSLFTRQDDNDILVDVLNTHWTYVGQGKEADIVEIYRGYKKAIEAQITKQSCEHIKAKWLWFANYFNSKVKNDSELRAICPIDLSLAETHFEYNIQINPPKSPEEAFGPLMMKGREVRLLVPKGTGS